MSDDPLADGSSDAADDGPSHITQLSAGIRDWLDRHRRTLVRCGLAILIIAAVVALEAAMWVVFGPLAAIAYTFAYLVGLTMLPVSIMLFQGAMPTFVGKLEFALGQLSFGRGWLVQHEHGWEMHPGEKRDGKEFVWIDDEWHEVVDTTNQTILGWQPFGLILNKEEVTLDDSRVDNELREDMSYETAGADIAGMSLDEDMAGTNETAISDGGQSTVTRGGVTEVSPEVSDVDEGDWLVDLKRYWSPGLEQMADIDVLEKVEEVTMRAEALTEAGDSKRMLVGTIVGLILGAATAYVVFAL